jgi:hypothetical protein
MKKIFSLVLLALPLTLLTISCEHKEEDPVEKITPYTKYKGPWEGTYSGSGDSGTITFTVKDDGSILGDIESEKFGESDLSLKGKVNIDGQVNIRLLHGGITDIGGFTGIMTETNASGTWINTSAGGITGSWVAGKR